MKDFDQIFSLLKKLNTLSFEEIEISTDGFKIRTKKNKIEHVVERKDDKEENEIFEEVDVSGTFVLRAPFMGTIYLTSNLDEAPFVQIGDGIKIGQTLCVIETRNIFNEIKSSEHGTIVEVLVENGSQVDQNQALFVIRRGSL